MGKIIEFQERGNNFEKIDETVYFPWLIERMKKYIEFLGSNVPKTDYGYWCELIPEALIKLGDYKLIDDLKQYVKANVKEQ